MAAVAWIAMMQNRLPSWSAPIDVTSVRDVCGSGEDRLSIAGTGSIGQGIMSINRCFRPLSGRNRPRRHVGSHALVGSKPISRIRPGERLPTPPLRELGQGVERGRPPEVILTARGI